MSAFKGLGIPNPTPELRATTPYLQRAEEVLKQEPIVAYWCAYYAAQLGISAKAKDSVSRNMLIELLDLLERLKQEIGSVDAMEMEAASAAYVENFGLRVFSLADNEDRQGKATRGTAKKFLAAAHFLEVLNVFGQSEISESTREKIKYAKWKAADISKAFREGRKPTPGPAGAELDTSEPLAVPSETPLAPPPVPSSPPINDQAPPPPQLTAAEILKVNSEFSPPDRSPLVHQDSSGTNPDIWSTAATPGTFTPHLSDVNSDTGPYTIKEQASETVSRAPVPDFQIPAEASAPPLPRIPTPPTPTKPVAPLPMTTQQQPFELTPLITAKAQKHARFAISALDYDDVVTARKELRNALSLLGE